MKKYKVYGTTTVTVTKEVWANNEKEAYEKAYDKLDGLTAYCGNGGYDKLIGVSGSDESVDAPDNIEYDYIEVLENDPAYFECPECGEECDYIVDNKGNAYFFCETCEQAFDEDGDEIYLEEEDENE